MGDITNLSTSTEMNSNFFSKNKYNIKLPDFEGPLDLLLYLVKNAEINIYDIPIADITHQYLEYLSLLIELDLDNISEFVEMAATLVLIKSKTMLPVELEFDGDEQDPRDELVAKILEYQKYKIAAGILDARMNDEVEFERKNTSEPVLFNLDNDTEKNWKPLTVIDLISAFAKVLNNNESENHFEVTMFDFSVEEKIDFIVSLLSNKESFNYFEVIRENMSKIELICTFLALLELVKQGFILIKQHIIFGDIHIVRRDIKLN